MENFEDAHIPDKDMSGSREGTGDSDPLKNHKM